jgi:hypothetical protein
MSILRITTRQRALSIAMALALAVLSSLPTHAVEPNDDILGSWKLTKVLDSSQISALDDKEAARLVGKTLVIAKEKVTLAGETCDDPEFERHYEDTVRYLREEAHAASGRLGLPSTVTVIDLACTEALLKGHDRIVLYWKGFFFDAVKLPPPEAKLQQARR